MPRFLRCFSCLLTCQFSVLFLLAQIAPDYVPFDYTCGQTNQFWLRKQALTKVQLSNFDAAYKKEASKILQERDSALKADCISKGFITDTAFCSYYNHLFNYLLAANNIPVSEMQLLISRVNWPNASSLGDGTVVLNIGLLKHLENEAQLAFILCHEIAHYKNGHSMKQLDAYFKKKYNKEVDKQLSIITKSEFGQNKAVLKLFANIVYDAHRHGRENETEADSLGLVYLSHTVFDLNASLRTMQILDSVDHEKDSLDYAAIFKSDSYPFQPFWIKKQKMMGFGAKDETINVDSLKTHPDCTKRAIFLQALINKMPAKPEQQCFYQPESSFLGLKAKVDYEIVNGLYDAKHYDYSLFQALFFAKQHPNDPFGVCMAVKSLTEMYKLYNSHSLMDFIHSPNASYSENFNQLLRMLSRMSVSDYIMVNRQLINKYDPLFASSHVFSSLEQQNQSIKP